MIVLLRFGHSSTVGFGHVDKFDHICVAGAFAVEYETQLIFLRETGLYAESVDGGVCDTGFDCVSVSWSDGIR